MGCKGYLGTFAVSGSALALSSALAQAADMPGYPPPLPQTRSSLIDANSGWCPRSDLGAH